MDELCCEACGAIATRTVHGIDLCDDCEIGGDVDAEPEAHWLNEVPSGLLDDDDDGEAFFNDLA
jgi:hypothetical protein